MKTNFIFSSLMVLATLTTVFAPVNANAITEDYKISPDVINGAQRFGTSVSVDADVIAVGAVEPDDSGLGPGSVYIYRFDGTDWIEQAILTTSDPTEVNSFGESVAVDNDVLVVGAHGDFHAGLRSGAVYVYRYDGTNWFQQAKLVASDAAVGDQFGRAVAINNDVIVVGAWHSADENDIMAGSAYVFRYDGASWVEESKLEASDSAQGDWFGQSVAVNGDTIVIGAGGNDDLGEISGSAYVFHHSSDGWLEQAKLLASDGVEGDTFGRSVSVGEVIVVGTNNNGIGAAYVFRFNGSQWNQEDKLTASIPPGNNDWFGISVATYEDRIVVGSSGTATAYLFRFLGTRWGEESRLQASDTDEGNSLGSPVSINEEFIVAIGGRIDTQRFITAAYVFTADNKNTEIVRGVITDNKAPYKDAFAIWVKNMIGLQEVLTDLDMKTIHIMIGPLSLEIPGNRFEEQPNGNLYYSSPKSKIRVVLSPDGKASIIGWKAELDGITNPVSLSIEIDDAYWQNTQQWQQSSNPKGIAYYLP
jgi:hypothetical protein